VWGDKGRLRPNSLFTIHYPLLTIHPLPFTPSAGIFERK
jgi:hypothetical protein